MSEVAEVLGGSPILSPTDTATPDQRIHHVSERFAAQYGCAPAVVAAAPGRVNLIGEHTDYNGGRALPIALPRRTYVAARGRTDGRVLISTTARTDSFEGHLDDLSPAALQGWPAYAAGVLWALRAEGWTVPGIELVADSDLPIGAGLSSSASLQCAIAVAVGALLGAPDRRHVREALVAVCQRAEHEAAGAPTGGMDQTAALLAEEGHALYLDFARASRRTVPWRLAGHSLLVVDTGVRHELADGLYANRRAECQEAATRLGLVALGDLATSPAMLSELTSPLLRRRARHVASETLRVGAAVDALTGGDAAELGKLMTESHLSLRDDFEVSCAELDLVVEVALEAGALGARLTGGGFGGCAVVLVEDHEVETVCERVALASAEAGAPISSIFLAVPAAAAGVLVSDDRERPIRQLAGWGR